MQGNTAAYVSKSVHPASWPTGNMYCRGSTSISSLVNVLTWMKKDSLRETVHPQHIQNTKLHFKTNQSVNQFVVYSVGIVLFAKEY